MFNDEFWDRVFETVAGMSEGGKLILAALVIMGLLAALVIKRLFARIGETKDVAEAARGQAAAARGQAALAATRSEPTSNGFAAGVQRQLTEISEAMIRVENQVDKLTGRVAELERPSILPQLPHLTSRRRKPAADDDATEQQED